MSVLFTYVHSLLIDYVCSLLISICSLLNYVSNLIRYVVYICMNNHNNLFMYVVC